MNNAANGAFSKGGAILSSGTLVVANSTFHGNSTHGNSAVTRGGAISIEQGEATFTNVTIAGNTTEGEGGGLNIEGTVHFRNSIISGNEPGNCAGLDLIDGGGNLRFPLSDGTCVGEFGDPLLAALGDNGGPTRTMALFPGSAAIDRIASANGCGFDITADQRGVARPQPSGGLCDIGAYEYVPIAVPTVSGWGIVAMSVLLIGCSAWFIRRRKQTDFSSLSAGGEISDAAH